MLSDSKNWAQNDFLKGPEILVHVLVLPASIWTMDPAPAWALKIDQDTETIG